MDEDPPGTLVAAGPIPQTLKAQSAEAIEGMAPIGIERATAATERERAEITLGAVNGMRTPMEDEIVAAVADHQIDLQETHHSELTIINKLRPPPPREEVLVEMVRVQMCR